MGIAPPVRSHGTCGHGFRARAASLRAVEDYTNKYKGEQVELALFGGEY